MRHLSLPLTALLVVLSASLQAQNLLPNDSFEEGGKDVATGWRLDFYEPAGHAPSSGGVSDTVAHSGQRSLYMTGSDSVSHAYWSYRNLPAEPGKRYALSTWVRLHGAMPPHSGFRVHLGFLNAKGEIISDKDHPFYEGWASSWLHGYSDWVPFGVAAVSPPGTATMAVTLRFLGVGETWVDDVKLVQGEDAVPEPPASLARAASFDAPEIAAGACRMTLKLRNTLGQPVSGLSISASGPAGMTGRSEQTVDLPVSGSANIPVLLSFPRQFSASDAQVLLTGKYRVGDKEETVQWLARMPVAAADLVEAVRDGRWGTPEKSVAGSAPLGVQGSVVTRAGKPQYVMAVTPVELQAGDALGLVVRVAATDKAQGPMKLSWECLDFYFRPATGEMDVNLPPGMSCLLKLDLPPSQVDRLLRTQQQAGADQYRITCRLLKGNEEVAAQTEWMRLKPLAFDLPKLPPLAERYDDLPVYGRLKLVDEVLCGDPADPHAMRQGGKALSTKYTSEPLDYYGGGARLTYDWALTYRETREEFTQLANVLGKPCRVTDNWGWFAYRMGRGQVQPGKHYVLVVEYPQDVSRNFLLWNGIDSRASFGFHTGSSLGDPHTRQRFMQKVDLPLSGRYERHYSLMSAQSGDGWVAVHSMGDKADPFSEGVAVHALRLYELGDRPALEALAMPAQEPAGSPRRLLGFISEDATPSAGNIASYRAFGMNFYAPVALSYCGGTYPTNSGYVGWPSKLFGPDKLSNPHALAHPGYYRLQPGITEPILAEGDRTGVTVMPLLEYGGTGQLPQEALAVWPDGSPHYYHWGTTTGKDGLRTMRYLDAGTCIDMAHPAVGEDLEKLVTELGDLYATKYKSFGGLILTHRFQAWQISYSDYEVRRFAQARGLSLPAGNLGQWVHDNHEAAFRQWYYERKRDNLTRAAAALRKVRPDLQLVILNCNGGDDNLHFGTPLYWWDKEKGDELLVPGRVSLPDLSKLDLPRLMEDYTRPDVAWISVGMNPPLYRQDRGLMNLAPAHYPFLCGNEKYLNHFRTGEGSAVCLWWIYNEDAFMNHPQIGWNCPGLHGNEPAGRYCMLDEVLAMAASDPFLMGVRIGDMNRGFPEYAREFAAAYRALPAVPSEIIKACGDEKIVVRRYRTKAGTYLGIINTGLGPEAVTVKLNAAALGGRRLCNLVTGATIEAPLTVTLQPVSLTAWRLE
ncbi:MAG: hypothetical protein ABFE08_19300 [Armatimonadia bacterium]